LLSANTSAWNRRGSVSSSCRSLAPRPQPPVLRAVEAPERPLDRPGVRQFAGPQADDIPHICLAGRAAAVDLDVGQASLDQAHADGAFGDVLGRQHCPGRREATGGVERIETIHELLEIADSDRPADEIGRNRIKLGLRQIGAVIERHRIQREAHVRLRLLRRGRLTPLHRQLWRSLARRCQGRFELPPHALVDPVRIERRRQWRLLGGCGSRTQQS
jgi:hypothetical protein